MPFVGALSKIPVNMAFLACRFGRLMLCRKGVKFLENYFFNLRNERHGCPFFLVSMTGTGEEIFSRHKSVGFDINPKKSIPKKTGLDALFKKSELGGTRTLDQLIKSQLLY
ncbi:MAG: hypothetical protein ACI4CY_01975, partial [Candidatus Gastranaerophilaceae bacterium]